MILLNAEATRWISSLKNNDSKCVLEVLQIFFDEKEKENFPEIDLSEFSEIKKMNLFRGLLKLSEVGSVNWAYKTEKTILVGPGLNPNGSGFCFKEISENKNDTLALSQKTLCNEYRTIYIIYYYINNIILNTNTVRNATKSIKRSDYSENKSIYEICGYLNTKCGTRYRASSEQIKKLIFQRISEGFSVDDFKQVIDTKSSSWMGTEFEKYLRPQTLFGNKFESYLNEKNPIASKKFAEKNAHSYLSDIMKGEA